uniref:Putative cytoplasmic protein n=1 Tax=uncultured Thiotrichaceae bacterium TaxID=298394 RepID=A0A6S6ULS6_9GAMM|nr:MAG: putative cytoplasmic protein [uncultured Thiotrichaceae bacterium]
MSEQLFQGCLSQDNLSEAYVHLTEVLSGSAFLSNQGLNNDIPFHICPFDPTLSSEVALLVRQLTNYLKTPEVKKQVLEINLYDQVVNILKREGDWEWFLGNEHTLSSAELKEELQSILDVETVMVPEISGQMAASAFDVLFVTGVGEVFPYIRSHNILNNLQPFAKEKPTLMFFPGTYQHSLDKGASLDLFGLITDDKYYRAFNILDRAI